MQTQPQAPEPEPEPEEFVPSEKPTPSLPTRSILIGAMSILVLAAVLHARGVTCLGTKRQAGAEHAWGTHPLIGHEVVVPTTILVGTDEREFADFLALAQVDHQRAVRYKDRIHTLFWLTEGSNVAVLDEYGDRMKLRIIRDASNGKRLRPGLIAWTATKWVAPSAPAARPANVFEN